MTLVDWILSVVCAALAYRVARLELQAVRLMRAICQLAGEVDDLTAAAKARRRASCVELTSDGT
jgi:hypothetical protein